ncbi:MAG: serine/threonine protein kinase, partial [Ruminococcus sp.]|nr:serine/threonine protein kinase [Ruminococcus sp.]
MIEIGSLVDDKYRVLREIGHGGMSTVYLAINEKANKTWAIKEVRKTGVMDFEQVTQGLIVETELVKKLNHPNLPSIIDVIENEDSLLIVMDYIEGKPLSKILEEYGAQPQELVIGWAKQLCDVLGYLHTRNPKIIYRDLKPANIMLKPNGGNGQNDITLIDFGAAREFKEKNLADTTCLGTIGYAAPEQFGGMGQTTERTDIFCLGRTLYQLVTGCDASELEYGKPITEIDPSLSSGLEKILQKCTQRDPQDRYQSCEELLYDFENYKTIDDAYRKKQKGKLAAFITMICCSVLFLAGGFVLRELAKRNASSQYDVLIDQAETEVDYGEKADIYTQCINIPQKAGDKRAYLALIQVYKENDQVFTKDEADNL